MIVESLIGLSIYTAYKYMKNLYTHHFKYEFNEIMKSLKLQNKLEQTYKIKYIYKTTYGFKCSVVIPYGLSISKLNSNIDILQDNLNGIIQIDKDKFNPLATMKIVMKDIDKFIYEPVKTKPNELYIGKLFDGKNFIIDLNKDVSIGIFGCSGTGKSMLMSVIFANLEYNSSKYIDTYLLQSMKSELSSFDECKSVVKACYDIDSCFETLEELVSELNKRAELFKQNGIRNIEQWNKHNKKDYMKRIIIFIDELSFFSENEECFDLICSIVKAGRSVGINLICCLQRSTADNFCGRTTVKSQMSKITFRQKSMIDSQNVINTNDATKLKERECIFDGNSNYELIKTPYIDDDFVILNKYIPEIKTPTKFSNENSTNSQVKQNSNNNHKEVNNNITINEENNTIQYMETHNFIEVENYKELPKPNNKRFKGKEKIND